MEKEEEMFECLNVRMFGLRRRCGVCAIDVCAPMVYNATMIFVETKLFTSRILDAMSDDEYAALQDHLSRHPDVGALIPGAGGVRKVRWAGSGRGK